MSVAVELWRALERFDPRQPRGADGRWGGGMRGSDGVARLEDDGDGIDLGFGNPEFRNGEPARGEDVNGHTARLDPAGMRKLHADLSAAVAEGSRRQKAVDAYYDEHDELPDDYEWKTTGYVAGQGADVHYKFELDDPSVGVYLYIAAIPHSSDDTIIDAYDAGATANFDAAETRRLLRMLTPPAQATESAALDLWRALEAWDAARHPRGPGGRFIKAGGGSERPSLADVIRGTAAGGPKRQRADKGGMSVADAVRSAARRSDSTGRPTQRTPAHHRAEGAHDVADEVERALADAGVPESMRAEVAARARAVADGHGKRPSAKLTDQDTRDLEEWLHHFGTEHRRSGAVMAELERRRAGNAPAAAASAPVVSAPPAAPAGPRREGIGGLLDTLDGIPRANERSLGREPLVDTVRRLQADVDAGRTTPQQAVGQLDKLSVRYSTIPNAENDAISTAIGNAATHLRSLPPPPRAKRPPAARMDADRLLAIHEQLDSATSTDEARRHLSGMTASQLRQVASFTQVAAGSGDTKQRLIDRIVDATAGRRLDAAAIDRMTRR